jgi:hypothetical protein
VVLRAVIESEADIPEALKSEYIEKDGKFYLDLDNSLNTHTAIVPLATALATTKREKKTIQDKLTALEAKIVGLPEDFDPSKYADILAELETLRADPNRDKDTEAKLQKERERYEQRLRDAETKRLADLKAKDDEIAERDGVIHETLIDGGLTDALVKHGIAKEFMGATRALLRGSVKVKKDDDGKRHAVVDTDLGEVDIDKFVENWSKSDDGKPFVIPAKGSGGHGSGNGRGSEINPWAKDSFNLTEQGRIMQTDKEKAKRFMKAAGRTQVEIDKVMAA